MDDMNGMDIMDRGLHSNLRGLQGFKGFMSIPSIKSILSITVHTSIKPLPIKA